MHAKRISLGFKFYVNLNSLFHWITNFVCNHCGLIKLAGVSFRKAQWSLKSSHFFKSIFSNAFTASTMQIIFWINLSRNIFHRVWKKSSSSYSSQFEKIMKNKLFWNSPSWKFDQRTIVVNPSLEVSLSSAN